MILSIVPNIRDRLTDKANEQQKLRFLSPAHPTLININQYILRYKDPVTIFQLPLYCATIASVDGTPIWF